MRERIARPGIVVVGSVHTDFVAVADRLPVPGETLPGLRFSTHPGGKGGNQAVAAARAGGRVAMLGRVGSDPFGKALRDALASAGVDVSWLLDDSAAATGASAVLAADGGDYCSVIVPGASARLSSHDVADARSVFADGKVVLAQLEIPIEPSLAALIAGKHVGCTTILNAAPAPGNAPAPPADLWAAVDIVVANRVEAGMLVAPGRPDPEGIGLAEDLRSRLGVAVAIVTLGDAGVAVAEAAGGWFEPAFRVDVADAIGAGDAFLGTLAVAMGQGSSLRAAVHRANAAGAVAVTRAGGYDAAPIVAEVDALLARPIQG